MTLHCGDVPGNGTYNCSNPWGQGCTTSEGFNFAVLWNITQNIQQACPTDNRLFGVNAGPSTPRNAALTLLACTAIAGSSWTYYSGADIWTRLTTWKFPLLQLVASFPRPPLSFWAEMFVVNHLLGDPIDTLKDLLGKMASCQATADNWRTKLEDDSKRPFGDKTDRYWKALTIITDAYAEWGEEASATETLCGLIDCPDQVPVATIIWKSADSLAADRTTKTLTIVVAQCIFIASVAIAIFRTAAAAGSTAASDTVYINVEAHSIAFSALFFWIIPAVFLGSIIGVSQTEANIPRILRDLEVHLAQSALIGEEIKLGLRMMNQRLDNTQVRTFHGGIYSWQPWKWQCRRSPSPEHNCGLTDASSNTTSGDISSAGHLEAGLAEHAAQESNPVPRRSYWTRYHLTLPYFIVLFGLVTGITVSALVPPDGMDCRHIAQILIVVVWVISAELDILLNAVFPLMCRNRNRLFWCTYAKDLIATCSTMGGVIATQVGVFNRCPCYTQWGRTGLALSEMPDVAAILRTRLGREYPAITFTSITIQLLIVPLAIWLWYGDAMRVFVQRDDGGSNAPWLWSWSQRYQRFKSSLSPSPRRLCKRLMSRRASARDTLPVQQPRISLTRYALNESTELRDVFRKSC